MARKFTNKFQKVVLGRLEIFYSRYKKLVPDSDIDFKEYCRKMALKSNTIFNMWDNGYVNIRIENAEFYIKNDSKTLALVYRNSKNKFLQC